MRVIVSTSKDFTNQEKVIDALSELPVSTVVLLPTRLGACKIIHENVDLLKLEIEDWSSDADDYETRGNAINLQMLNSEVDMCIVFDSKNCNSTKDCIRQARNSDLDVNIIT
jgi:hypothetical protein